MPDETANLFEIMATTRLMRRLKPDPVPAELIRKVLEAGVSAPSGGNMQRWRFLVVTECGLSDRLLLELPEKKFYKACKLCQYMKMITLEETAEALRRMQHSIVIEEAVRARAERAIRRMFELG